MQAAEGPEQGEQNRALVKEHLSFLGAGPACTAAGQETPGAAGATLASMRERPQPGGWWPAEGTEVPCPLTWGLPRTPGR